MNWRSPWARLGLVIILGITLAGGWASYRQYERSVRIQAEIERIRQEANRIARENDTLSEKIQYFASPDYKEGEAKEKLGLRRQEEKVVLLDGGVAPSLKPSSAEDTEPSRQVDWDTPNYLKWRDLFFRH